MDYLPVLLLSLGTLCVGFTPHTTTWVGRKGSQRRKIEHALKVTHSTSVLKNERQRFVTPYQVLYPSSFPKDSDASGYDTFLSLQSVFTLFEHTLQAIIQNRNIVEDMGSTVLRIEHRVGALDDLLGWLRCQERLDGNDMLYFATQEGCTEVATIGSMLRINSTEHIWSYDLPLNSRWYGGSRFDPLSDVSEQWQDYGRALWIIPTVELCRKRLSNGRFETFFAIHLSKMESSWGNAAEVALQLLRKLTPVVASPTAPTTLPPILSRDSGVLGQERYEDAVAHAMKSLNSKFEKVVLARQLNLYFSRPFSSLDMIARWKYGGSEGGHLFWIKPANATTSFFGCTPERLLKVTPQRVMSEALAGTRPRGSTQQADDDLLQDLFSSPKDRKENTLTGLYIEKAFDELSINGLVETWRKRKGGFFVRRLLHLQHICQLYTANLLHPKYAINVTRTLLSELHPTPAVCGVPMDQARDFIRLNEGFDRGFYAGPVGYVGQDSSDIFVAIRSALSTSSAEGTSVTGFAGGGLVAGSTLRGEWQETNHKFSVISSLFPQSPMSLRTVDTPNMAWATAFVEELIRCGIVCFYICPGSRSTPLVVAIAKAVRVNFGVVRATSVHDERAAGFRALGFSRSTGRPVAVVTSSGTAVANLYPAIIEASMDGIPMVVLTADRPYENRETGANQAIDQVKVFSQSYIRWFRDILPPSDDVPVSAALSDAGHAVDLAVQLRGPVHLNVQFRENLAPDGGLIRNDDRSGSTTKFDGIRFTDVPGFGSWSRNGRKWCTSYSNENTLGSQNMLADIVKLIQSSERGMIVVGNLRRSASDGCSEDQAATLQAIADFSKLVGFPVFAGAQSASLRFRSSTVVPFAEHLLKCTIISENLDPDLVVQIGAQLVSTAVPAIIRKAAKKDHGKFSHILIHPHTPNERYDPDYTVTHKISTEILCGINSLLKAVSVDFDPSKSSSQLSSLVSMGRILQASMKNIIFEAAKTTLLEETEKTDESQMTEPELVVALVDTYTTKGYENALFLSNSMPIRDAECFFYPMTSCHAEDPWSGPRIIGSNRGASGIDGIISSALGFSESGNFSTTLLVGDLATLHDIGSFHSVANNVLAHSQATNKILGKKLTTVVVNNGGGGIFSFLPIAQHGNDVSFEEFFGTPTDSFSFQKGADAFGLGAQVATDYHSFLLKYNNALDSPVDSIIEARMVGRPANVAVHQKISKSVEEYVNNLLIEKPSDGLPEILPTKIYSSREAPASFTQELEEKTLVLLHGWMGDKFDWDETAKLIDERLSSNWTILSIDLPGHGASPRRHSSPSQALRSALRLDVPNEDVYSLYKQSLNIDGMAESVLTSLSEHHGVKKVDAIAGYSAGGRVALAMQRICSDKKESTLLNAKTSVILLCSYPGDLTDDTTPGKLEADTRRLAKDDSMSREISRLCDRACLLTSSSETNKLMHTFLTRWYGNSMWGLLQSSSTYKDLIQKRSSAFVSRGRDISMSMSQCSPMRNSKEDWRYCSANLTLFIAGELDGKYVQIGETLKDHGICHFDIVPKCGHAVLLEAPHEIANLVVAFLSDERNERGGVSKQVNPVDDANEEPTGEAQTLDAQPVLRKIASPARANMPPLWAMTVDKNDMLDSIAIRSFTLDIRKNKEVTGIGWGENAAVGTGSKFDARKGFVIQLDCTNGLEVGLGEVSPLPGLHVETLDEARQQLDLLQTQLLNSYSKLLPEFKAEQILSLNGSLGELLADLALCAGLERFVPSVQYGLEMAILSLAAQKVGIPIHQSLLRNTLKEGHLKAPPLLSLNGLITRGHARRKLSSTSLHDELSFPSMKVKVGHQDLCDECQDMLRGFQYAEMYSGDSAGRVRVDANRSWNEGRYLEFASALEGLDVRAFEKLEFVEEPLEKVINGSGWSLRGQVEALEKSFNETTLPYALDESLADLVHQKNSCFDSISKALVGEFKNNSRGCAAFVLKPAVIGIELCLQIAELAKRELGISIVVSSSFDSGLGLAHTAMLGFVIDRIAPSVKRFSHGLGTFASLSSDVLAPPFESYVSEYGLLNIPSLSRALYGLSLDEINDFLQLVESKDAERPQLEFGSELCETSKATNCTGNEISVVVSLPLPFAAETACSRFTDLPSMSRWSPWISSVHYDGAETEWTISVRGIPLKWRAKSEIVQHPYPGIEWNSVSGLSNRGIVEFIADELTGGDLGKSCVMNVRMVISPPRMLKPLFRETSLFIEDFIRDKILKWSLEMFRDVVKADLALERGDVELGDALIGAVEGRANAIEATLKSRQNEER